MFAFCGKEDATVSTPTNFFCPEREKLRNEKLELKKHELRDVKVDSSLTRAKTLP